MTIELLFPVILFGCLGLIITAWTAVAIGFAIKELQETFK
jgi:hypothetical protein